MHGRVAAGVTRGLRVIGLALVLIGVDALIGQGVASAGTVTTAADAVVASGLSTGPVGVVAVLVGLAGLAFGVVRQRRRVLIARRAVGERGTGLSQSHSEG